MERQNRLCACHETVWRSGGTARLILNLGTGMTASGVSLWRKFRGTHWTGGWGTQHSVWTLCENRKSRLPARNSCPKLDKIQNVLQFSYVLLHLTQTVSTTIRKAWKILMRKSTKSLRRTDKPTITFHTRGTYLYQFPAHEGVKCITILRTWLNCPID